MKNKNFIFILLSLFFLLSPYRLQAAIPVIDGANLAENILTAIRTLQSNLNEATMIANQVKQLRNDLKNLTKLDLSIVDEYSSQLHALFDEVGQVQGLMQNLSTLQAEFERLYPDFNNNPNEISSIEMSRVLNEALNESRDMMRGAAKTGAMVLENLPRTQSQLDSLMRSSDNAIGNLAALQAGNQITATVSSNLISLNALIANYSQAHISHLQKINTQEAATSNRMEHVLRGIDEPPSSGKVGRRPF